MTFPKSLKMQRMLVQCTFANTETVIVHYAENYKELLHGCRWFV
jgi:hypothetical protein